MMKVMLEKNRSQDNSRDSDSDSTTKAVCPPAIDEQAPALRFVTRSRNYEAAIAA